MHPVEMFVVKNVIYAPHTGVLRQQWHSGRTEVTRIPLPTKTSPLRLRASRHAISIARSKAAATFSLSASCPVLDRLFAANCFSLPYIRLDSRIEFSWTAACNKNTISPPALLTTRLVSAGYLYWSAIYKVSGKVSYCFGSKCTALSSLRSPSLNCFVQYVASPDTSWACRQLTFRYFRANFRTGGTC
jgi:hypothetical protein